MGWWSKFNEGGTHSIRKENLMRNKLIAIYNTLIQIETKGDNTVMMADCLRELASIVNSMPSENASIEENKEN